MKFDILLAGVGGQGILSIASIVANGAMHKGLFVKQSEVHGMSQRGGAVVANLRMADQPIHSDLIPAHEADMILSLELLESLRYLEFLKPSGILLTSSARVVNVPNYPPEDDLRRRVDQVPHHCLVDADALAKQAGNHLASNMVMVGAASHWLPLGLEEMEGEMAAAFSRKGEKVVQTNLKAFALGREAASWTPA
ncbi:MAG: indolepyruvate oxidoreductase subunit beta [Planctomycetota bacterium]|nr:MAG: indolepyruvate oxidoreductase subunit beta [Planctomycetota bacterium]